jgi:putative transposase
LERRPLLSRSAAAKVSAYLSQYAAEKGIYMKINYVNPEHVHALVDLPTRLCIEEAMHLFKGGSSHWINESSLIPGKFGWGRGYGAFSVSHSGAGEVASYIAAQEEHHRRISFSQELKRLVERYELRWHEDETVEDGFNATTGHYTPLKRGVNESRLMVCQKSILRPPIDLFFVFCVFRDAN